MSDDIVVLRRYVSEIDARVTAAVLEAEGIPVQLLMDTAGGAYPSLALMKSVGFAVRAADAERAAAILNRNDGPDATDAAAEDAGADSE